MKFGICIPNNWGVEDVRDVIEIATRAERLGFDSVWVSEHIFNVTYVWDRIGTKPYYEPLTVLTYVAAVTSRVRLGTSVLVLPYHNPIRLAKTTATLDVVSGGRLDLGVGVGVIEPELEAMGSSLAQRGAMADEAIAIMTELWTKDVPTYQGSYHSFPPMVFTPKPAQKPHIPLLVGGSSRGAIRRAARVGGGWHASTQSPEDLDEKQGYLRERLAAAGREEDDFPISIRMDMGVSRAARDPLGASRYSLGTDPEEVLQGCAAFSELGVEHMVISPTTGDIGAIRESVEMLAEAVIPRLR